MAVSVSLNPITTGFNLSKINQNFENIQEALENALGRLGDNPNSMEADIDMNSKDIINANSISTTRLYLNGNEVVSDFETKGDRGWTPVTQLVVDGSHYIRQLVGYIGGEGQMPTDNIGLYEAVGGWTANTAAAINARGPQGPNGPGTGDILSTNNGNDFDDIPTTFDTLKQYASTSYSGVVELADETETVDGIDDTRATTPAGVKAAIDNLAANFTLPVGIIAPYAGPASPSGWLLCYGQAVSRSTYSTLFTVLGTTYGPGDGVSTFNVPDLRGRVIGGKDNMGGSSANRLTGTTGGVDGSTLGNTGGSQTHQLSIGELAMHTHSVDPPSTSTSTDGQHNHTFTVSDPGFAGIGGYVSASSAATSAYTFGTSSNGNHSHTIDIAPFNSASSGNNQSHNNTQPTIILNYIIYTGV